MKCDGFKSATSAERCEIPASYAICADDGGRIDADAHICFMHKKECEATGVKVIIWRLDEPAPRAGKTGTQEGE